MNRTSIQPYLSGDTFKSCADFVLDETNNEYIMRNISSIFNGAIIFIKSDFLKMFFEQIYHLLTCKIIIISHNSDFTVPNDNNNNGNFSQYLVAKDSKIIKWYGINAQVLLVEQIPIGIANRQWPHGNFEILSKHAPASPSDLATLFLLSNHRFILLYLNINVKTYSERQKNLKDLSKNGFSHVESGGKSWEDYLQDLKNSKFCFCPRGNGIDTHRTWESLYMGCIPVVEVNELTSLYLDLPIILVSSYTIVTPDFLELKYMDVMDKMKKNHYNLSKLYSTYWFNKLSPGKSIVSIQSSSSSSSSPLPIILIVILVFVIITIVILTIFLKSSKTII